MAVEQDIRKIGEGDNKEGFKTQISLIRVNLIRPLIILILQA